MHPSRVGLGLMAALMLLASQAPLHAETTWQLVPELELGGGLDTNFDLEASVDPHALGGSSAERRAFFEIAPAVTGRMAASGHVARLALGSELRLAAEEQLFAHSQLRASYRTPRRARLALEVGLAGEHRTSADTRMVQVETLLALLATPTRHIGVALHTRTRARRDRLDRIGTTPVAPSTPDALGLEAGATIALGARGFDVELGYGFLLLDSELGSLDERRHRASAGGNGRLGRLAWSLGYTLSLGRFPGEGRFRPRSDVAHEVTAGLGVTVRHWLEPFTRIELSRLASDDGADDVTRWLVGAGVSLRWPMVATGPGRAPTRASGSPMSAGASRDGSPVRFSWSAAQGARVAIRGDFTGWAAVPLHERSPGRFVYEVALPSGRYTYQLTVNGVTTVPEGPREEDGLGGYNAVIVVP